MITIEGNELERHPIICMWLQLTHEDPEVREILFNPANDFPEGGRFRRGYFKIYRRNYLHYKMEYTIKDLERKVIGRKLVWLQVFDSFTEFEATRVKILQALPADQQEGFSLN